MAVTSPNRVYLALAIAFAQILLRRTSDTLKTLGEMRTSGAQNIKKENV